MTGAIVLSGCAALRSGAGLVTLAVPDVCLATVAAAQPCYMTVPLPSDADGRTTLQAAETLTRLASRATAGACGPGWGRSADLTELARTMYTSVSVPMVFDADALNALAEHPRGLVAPGGCRILTPHPGEFDRLCGGKPAAGEARARRAVELAARHTIVVVLKGHRTLITDGVRTECNETGNPGMATGGAGDVLTGIITALLCQGLEGWEAARLGVHIHGLAGDHAARRYSQIAMTALDLVHCLGDAWREFQADDGAAG